MVYAEPFTRNKIESCAYLLGSQQMHQKKMKWCVQAIFIPYQKGDAVSCQCSEEHDPGLLVKKCEEASPMIFVI